MVRVVLTASSPAWLMSQFRISHLLSLAFLQNPPVPQGKHWLHSDKTFLFPLQLQSPPGPLEKTQRGAQAVTDTWLSKAGWTLWKR